MPVPSSITELSQTASSNYPTGAESPITADNYWRAHAAFIAQLRDGAGFTNPATLASATTTSIGAQASMFVEITGTTTITSFGTSYNGPRFLRFTGALTLTHNATTLNLPGASSITTAAGDTCIAIPNSTGNGWNVVNYQRVDPGYLSAMNGRCRLSYQSTTALILTPYNGNTIVINGQVVTIPSAGVTLSNSGVTNGTKFIYVYLNSGVPTLEASTTGHSTDSATGVEIKTGDATRTLVGMARLSGGIWVNSSTIRYVLSYFNRREIVASNAFTSTVTTTSTSYTDLGFAVDWLTWADEPVKFSVNGSVYGSGTLNINTSIGVDGTSAQDVVSIADGATTNALALSHANSFSEGYHYSTALGKVTSGTGYWVGSGTAGERTTHQAIVMG